MIRNIKDFTNIELYDEMIINGEEKQPREELEAIIDEYNKNVGIFKKKSKSMLLKAYDMNWKMSEKRCMNEIQIGIHEEQAKKHKEEFKQSLKEINDAKNDFKQNINNLEEPRQMNNDLKNKKLEKEIKLEQKFGIIFQNKNWFECTIEERKYSTFNNTDRRDVDTAYVIVEDEYLEIAKESVFLKSNMGHRKVYYQNVAGIDYDARGKFHLSNGLIINLKSSEHVQLKNISERWVKYITDKYEQYLARGNVNTTVPVENRNNVDDLMKYAELYEKGLLTKEEFDLKKSEIMGTPSSVEETVSSAKFCSNCGNPIDSDCKFCPNCGNQL